MGDHRQLLGLSPEAELEGGIHEDCYDQLSTVQTCKIGSITQHALQDIDQAHSHLDLALCLAKCLTVMTSSDITLADPA